MTTHQQDVPQLELADGRHMPQLGYGVWQVPDDEAARCVALAIDAGYRSIDTAAIYENERGVGEAIAACGVAREELFVTTKLWNDSHAHEDALRAFDASLRLLDLDHVDLYLMHWPSPSRDQFVEAWGAMVELNVGGRARSIGVSNFAIEHLERIISATSIAPVLNQVELHPYFQQRELRAWCAERDIAVEAWSPLGQGGELLHDPVIAAIAETHGRSAAQVVLRWHLQSDLVVIPKSVTPSRIADNIDVFDFELTQAQMAEIDGLDRTDGRIGPDPSTATF